ncbi:hypothetical protein [Streptomyces griseomycini]|uniref:Uncharacterized protein n=1 Tax=Streptomyces griseomycini TaxID=66895 RepID=A0A7W7PWI4_9ACTN|nr:hypothetical protein [Streptomyces griseomycini]MBB4902570.1 hypothetical protein [Streptomyces griseomycini]GGR54229.1 hypothetical protein GCM10015536_69410 [Streptomyces griseomycini]
MIYLTTPSGDKVRAAMAAGHGIAWMSTPACGHVLPAGQIWAADNGRFGKGWPGYERWWRYLESHADRAGDCLFAVAPDIPMDAAATLEESRPWLPKIRALGYRAAFAAQDGAEDLPVPWDDLDVLFLAGSTEWKLGPGARVLALEAKRRGKRVHMGRVNSLKRLRYAHSIGCDSADGTFVAFGPDKNLPKCLAWVAELNGQEELFPLKAPAA